MSYNIDSTEYLKGKLSIKRKIARIFKAAHKNDLAEGNFLSELDLAPDKDDDELLPIELPWWYGEHSGNSYETFKQALALTVGNAEILCVWEGGDSQNGLSVKNGVVTEKKTKIQLED